MRERIALALRPGCQEHRRHRSAVTDADGRDVRAHMLHRVVNSEACRNVTTGAVDVQRDILFRILVLKENQLGHDVVRHFVVDRRSQEDNAFLEEAGIDIVGTFPATGGFNNGRYNHRLTSYLDSAAGRIPTIKSAAICMRSSSRRPLIRPDWRKWPLRVSKSTW